MKLFTYIFFFSIFFGGHSQENIPVVLKDSTSLKADVFLHKDTFGALYYLKENTLYKRSGLKNYSYKNLLLGNIKHVDVLNPLEITLFYEDFNTVVQLDNRLNEINRIDFNSFSDFKSMSYAATASNKRLWLYNTNNLQLEVYNALTNKTEARTQPITQNILGFKSNYNFCWLLTTTGILQYNIYGSVLNNYPLESIEQFSYSKNNFIIQIGNNLFWINGSTNKPKKLNLPKIAIQDFSLSHETLYIYDGKTLFTYQITFKN